MCHFLTIAVPSREVPQVPDSLRRDVHFSEHTNPSAKMHTPGDWTSFIATSGGCSCDFYRATNDPPDSESKLISKYQKKGWSEAKIQRAISSRSTAATQSSGLRDDIVDLVANLTNRFGQIRISLHWYSGDIETEKFTLRDAGSVSLARFQSNRTIFEDETSLQIKDDEEAVRSI